MKSCPYCGSHDIRTFYPDNDQCIRCNKWFEAVPDIKLKKDSSISILEDFWFPETKSKFQKLQDELGQWADETFGPRTPLSLLHHLKEEVGELMDAPHDESEWADCLTLLIDSYRLQTGKNTDQLIDACFEKLDINKQRTWNAPDENGISRHIKE